VPEIAIRPARPDEGERLRQIAIDAKGHWGYDREWIRSWAAQGDFSSEALQGKPVLVAEAEGRAVGFAALIPQGAVAVLDDLWIEPAWIGRGVGSELFEACVARARELGAERMEWEAEPNAVGFYEKLGGRYLRDSEPTEWGRIISVMGINLT
jgi:N-acetylglutamate synthase-like GNAT family acetyltransferase